MSLKRKNAIFKTSCLNLCDAMDYSGLNPCLLCPLHWQPGSLLLATPGRPIPFQIIFPYGLLQDNKYSFLWYTVGPGGFPFYI